MITKFNKKKTRQLDKVNKLLKLICKKPATNRNTDISIFRRIIIVDFGLVGDMVMNLPFIRQIKNNCPDSKIVFVGLRKSKEVLELQGLIDHFIVFNGQEYLSTPFKMLLHCNDIKKTLKRINQEDYDIAIEPKGDLRHLFFMHFIKANRSISYNYTGGEYLITDSFSPKKETRHLIDEKMDLLEMSGFVVDREQVVPRLITAPDDEETTGTYIVGLHPGASCKNKVYRHYDKVISHLSGIRKDCLIYLFKDPDDNMDNYSYILETLKQERMTYQVIECNLQEYIKKVSKCQVMICNDSSAGHIAAAYGIPVIVIFGAIQSETALPRGSRVIAVEHQCDCKPCTLDDCELRTYECLEKIDINEIFQAMEKIIEKE